MGVVVLDKRSMLLVAGLWIATVGQAFAQDIAAPRAVVAMRMDGGVICSSYLRVCWTGIDDVTSPARLVYSWRMDDGKWTPYSRDTRTELTGLVEGSHTFTVKAKDEAGNEEADPKVTRFRVCLSGPRITNISITPAADRATVTWTTDVPCFSQIDYGPTKAYGSVACEPGGLFTDHKMVLDRLAPGNLYHARISSKNACEIESVSLDQAFSTAKQPAGAAPTDTPGAQVLSVDAPPSTCQYVTVCSKRPTFTRTGRGRVSKAYAAVGDTVVFSAPPPLLVTNGEERDVVVGGDATACPDRNITAIVPKIDYAWTVYGPSGSVLKQGFGLVDVEVVATDDGDYQCKWEAQWAANAKVLDPKGGTIDMGSVTSACANWDLRVEVATEPSGKISLGMDAATGEPVMPDIRARATTRGGRYIDRETLKWKARISYQTDQHGAKAAPWRELVLDSSELTKVGEVTFTRSDWASVACGTLTLIAEYTDSSGKAHKGVSKGVEVEPCSDTLPWGNPEPWMLRKALRDILDEIGDPDLRNCCTALYSIAYLESGLRQFWESLPGRPCWSGDKLGGVGLMQITYPPPTLEQTWNWKADLRAGVTLFRVKIQVARDYWSSVQDSFNDPNGDYHHALDKYNEVNHPLDIPVTVVDVQPYTQDQIVRDAVRCYNGCPGRDPVGRKGLHESRIKFENGVLVLTNVRAETRDGVRVGVGTATWEPVTTEMRKANYQALGIGLGTAGYVDRVLGSSIQPGDPMPMR